MPQLTPVSGDPFAGAYDDGGAGAISALAQKALAAGDTIRRAFTPSVTPGDPNATGPNRLMAIGNSPIETAIAQGVASPFVMAHDVAYGKLNPFSSEGIDQAAGTALGLVAGGMHAAEPGAAGIFGGRLSKTADLPALAKAQDMQSAGAPRGDIWNNTGWFQGPDKQWRYEIPDHESFMKGSLQTGVASRADNVGLAIRHPELFEAYPALADANFSVGDIGNNGSFSNGHMLSVNNAPTIRLNSSLNNEQARSTMLHELQHAVQGQDGFSTGANPKNYTRSDWESQVLSPLDRRVQDLMAQHPEAAAAYRARNQEQAYLQAKHGDNWFDKASSDDLSKLGPLEQRFQETPGGAELDDADWSRRSAMAAVKAGHGFDDWRMDQYGHTAGEVEARNVQTRRDMTPEQRQATPPWQTQDVPDEQQIVRMLNDPNKLKQFLANGGA